MLDQFERLVIGQFHALDMSPNKTGEVGLDFCTCSKQRTEHRTPLPFPHNHDDVTKRSLMTSRPLLSQHHDATKFDQMSFAVLPVMQGTELRR